MGSIENTLNGLFGVMPLNSQFVGSSISPTGFELGFGSLGSIGLGSS